MFAAKFRFCFAFGTIAAIVAGGAAPEHTRLAAAPSVTMVAWSPCHRDLGLPFECGQVQVPLDHDDPGGATISIALVRLPAADPTRRIGSLFLTPAAPAGPASISRCLADRFSSGASSVRGSTWSASIRAVSRAAPRCAVSALRGSGCRSSRPSRFPSRPRRRRHGRRPIDSSDDACAQRGSRIIDHMATGDVARELDLLRQAVGDEQLIFVGYSYG